MNGPEDQSKTPLERADFSIAQLNLETQHQQVLNLSGNVANASSKEGRKLPPQDGRRAWLVVLGSFVAHFAALGFLYSFGIFVEIYRKEFNATSATVSTAYTVGLATFFLVGIVAGRLSDKYGVKIIFSIGSVIFVAALVGASFSQSLAGTIVSHGFFLGVGTSLCYFPAVSVVPMWFDKRRSIAMGFAVLGSGLGSICFSIAGQSLFDSVGWRRALQIAAGFSAGLLVIAGLLLDRRLPRESKAGLFSDNKILKDRNYQYLICGAFLFQFAFMIPYVYLAAYAQSQGISSSNAALATGFFGIGSAIGRLVLSAMGDYLSSLKIMRVSVISVGICMFAWPACTTLPSILAFALFYGFFSGGFIACNPVVLADFFGAARLGGLMGYQNLFMVPGALAGAPIAGYLNDSTHSYLAGAMFGGAMLIGGGFFLCMLDSSKMLKNKKAPAALSSKLPEPSTNLLRPNEGHGDDKEPSGNSPTEPQKEMVQV